AESGTYNVTVSVTDKDGGTATSGAATINVSNVGPTVGTPSVSPPSSSEGSSTSFSVSGTFTDPAAALDQPFTAVVSWGDGVTDTIGSAASRERVNYAVSGTHI